MPLRNALPIIAILYEDLTAAGNLACRWHEGIHTVTIGLDAAANDSYQLRRFVEAQANCLARVHEELAGGQKRTHWMWFIFPQIHGLGSSAMARQFAITGVHEACAYLLHPVLGPRLRDCVALVNAVRGCGLDEIFGYPDDLKFHSSMTLFGQAAGQGRCAEEPANRVFAEALEKYFAGKPDPATLQQLRNSGPK